jgi:hypothetical protein
MIVALQTESQKRQFHSSLPFQRGAQPLTCRYLGHVESCIGGGFLTAPRYRRGGMCGVLDLYREMPRSREAIQTDGQAPTLPVKDRKRGAAEVCPLRGKDAYADTDRSADALSTFTPFRRRNRRKRLKCDHADVPLDVAENPVCITTSAVSDTAQLHTSIHIFISALVEPFFWLCH